LIIKITTTQQKKHTNQKWVWKY